MAEVYRKVQAKMGIRQDFRYTEDDLRTRGCSQVSEANGIYTWKGPDGTFQMSDTRDTEIGVPVYRVISRSW
jgi:hypothetical protein